VTLEDAQAIYDMYGMIDEFKGATPDIERIGLPLETGTGRIFKLEINEAGSGGKGGAVFESSNNREGSPIRLKLVSSVATTAETSDTAIIVGLMTLPEYRGKGFGTLCLLRICQDLINNGKTVYLTYDNPNAGRIYRKIGFREIGMWWMAELK